MTAELTKLAGWAAYDLEKHGLAQRYLIQALRMARAAGDAALGAARGHFPTEQAALKCLYLVTRSLDPTGVGRARWMMRWKPAVNAFAITFADRWPDARTY